VTGRTGFLWDSPQMFTRLIEECTGSCEAVTPQLLASPFFRGRFNAIVIPTGFGNPAYSRLLPALRASSGRIERYLEAGGRILVFGAADDRPDAYDWLPFRLTYRHGYAPRCISFAPGSPWASLTEGYDTSAIECDGIFPEFDGTAIATTGAGEAVVVEKAVGKGLVLAATVHEYPSRSFLASFSSGGDEALL
jgi:subtilisin family serine protease